MKNFMEKLNNPKSFWSRPEGTTGMITLAALVIGGAIMLDKILPFVIGLLANGLTALLLGVVTIGVSYFLWTAWRNGTLGLWFKIMMRKFTGFVIEMDPYVVAFDKLDKLDDKVDTMKDGKAEVDGKVREMEDKIRGLTEQRKKIQEKFKLATEKSTRELILSELGSVEDALKRLEPLTALLKRTSERIMKPLIENLSVKIQSNRTTLKQKQEVDGIVKSGLKTLRAANSILTGKDVDNALYDQAMDKINEDLSMNMAEFDNWVDEFTPIVDDMSLDRQANLQVLESKLKSLESKAVALPMSLPMPIFEKEKVLVKRN